MPRDQSEASITHRVLEVLALDPDLGPVVSTEGLGVSEQRAGLLLPPHPDARSLPHTEPTFPDNMFCRLYIIKSQELFFYFIHSNFYSFCFQALTTNLFCQI